MYNILIKLHLIDFRDLIIPSSNIIQQTNDTIYSLGQKNETMFEKCLLFL